MFEIPFARQRKQTHCGFCKGPLVDVGDAYECPRCVPLLAEIQRARRDGGSWDAYTRAFARFEREAKRAHERG